MPLPEQKPSNEKLGAFLSKAVGEKLLVDDIDRFRNLVTKNCISPDDKTLLENINPTAILRNFFPSIQLSKSNIDFLLDCKIIFRSQNPLFYYDHHSGLRMRYEHSMSFLMLFVLINYGLHFRIMSVPNSTHIGVWGNDLLTRLMTVSDESKTDYTIEIVPTSFDLSMCLDSVPVFNQIADQFILAIFENPQRAYDLRQLRNEMADSLKSLSGNVNQTLISIHQELLTVRDSTDKGHDVNNLVADEKSEFCVETLTGPLTKIFEKDGNDYILKNSWYGVEPRKQPIYTNFFNIFFILHLCSLAKVNGSLTGANGQYSPYKNVSEDPANPEALPASNHALRILLYGKLAQTLDYPMDEIINHMEAFKLRLAHSSISPWVFLIPSIRISKQDLANLFVGENFQFFRKVFLNFIGFENVIDLERIFETMSSKDLLGNLLNPATVTESNRCYIRKIQDYNKFFTIDILDKEFNVQANPTVSLVSRVRPATLILPDVPIDTYPGKWENCSGVVILTTPGNVEMVGYKRPANSNRLSQPHLCHTLGFPYYSESVLRYQGGKPSFNENDFARRINTIYARSKGQFPDLNRKEYFALSLFDYANQFFLNRRLKQEDFIFTTDINEVGVLIGGETFDKDKHTSDNFKNIFDFYLYMKQKLDKINCLASIKQYYLSLFHEIIRMAFNNNSSFVDALHAMQMESKKTRQKMMHDHCKSSFYSGMALPFASGLRTSYSIIIGKNATSLESNEALLQGLVIRSKFREDVPLIMNDGLHTAPADLQQRELQKRNGNYAAIYVNTNTTPSLSTAVKPVSVGVINAIILYDYILTTFKLDLPFATYTPTDQRQFRVGTASEFKSANHEAWELASRLISDLPLLSTPNPVASASPSPTPSSLNVTSLFSPTNSPTQNTSRSRQSPFNPTRINNKIDVEEIVEWITSLSTGPTLIKVFSLQLLAPDHEVSFSSDIDVKFTATNEPFKFNHSLTINLHCTTRYYSTKDCVASNVFPHSYAVSIAEELRKFSKVVVEAIKMKSAQTIPPDPNTYFSAEIEFKNIKRTYKATTATNSPLPPPPNLKRQRTSSSSAATNAPLAAPLAATVVPPPPPPSGRRQRPSSSSSSSTAPFVAFFSPPPAQVSPVLASIPTLAFPIGLPPSDPNAAPSKSRKRKK